MMNTYSMGFVHNILPHEMGHYLSLYHTFEYNSPSHCVDADFCPDTEEHYITNLESHNWDNLLDNCEGSKFLSTNYMDYIVYSNSFTHDQSARMRVTHEHAHFFPRDVNRLGSRVGRFQKGKLDLSIKPVYCHYWWIDSFEWENYGQSPFWGTLLSSCLFFIWTCKRMEFFHPTKFPLSKKFIKKWGGNMILHSG